MNISFTDQEILKLKMLNISALILFGSKAQGVANDASDFDIFVIGKKTASAYDFVYEIISEKINKLINLDIVFETSAPMELQSHVAKYGQVLYQENNSVFPDFKQKIMIFYSDFAPLRQIYSNATIKRINP